MKLTRQQRRWLERKKKESDAFIKKRVAILSEHLEGCSIAQCIEFYMREKIPAMINRPPVNLHKPDLLALEIIIHNKKKEENENRSSTATNN